MARDLLVPCHLAVHNGVGPWASFVLERVDDGDIVAIAALEQRRLLRPLYEHEASYIPVVAVASSCQRMGYSRTLMAAVLAEASQQRGPYVWAEVAENNQPAQRLFGHNGFDRCPVRKLVVPNATHAMWVRDK